MRDSCFPAFETDQNFLENEMKIKTSELTGAALDWAVARCWYTDRAFEPTEGRTTVRVLRSPDNTGEYHSDWFMFRPSTDWSQGGPIIEREKISILEAGAFWGARPLQDGVTPTRDSFGPTPLIAAMRCYVASKMGETVEIPDGLC